MGYIKENLVKDEEIILPVELHGIKWLNVISFSILFLLPGLIMWLSNRGTDMAVTSKRVIKKTGIIGRTIDEIRYDKIETVEFDQGILGRMLNYGTIKVTGAGSSKLHFFIIRDPKAVKKAIDEQLD